MRTVLPVFSLIIFVFSSCTRYQYATISSVDTKKNDQQEFVIENDSLIIKYNFHGLNAPLRLTIENKLNVPIYIDWRQSALIINDRAISYVPNTIPVSGIFNGSSINSITGNFSTNSGNIDARATLQDNLVFIPPRSNISKSPMGLTNSFFNPSDSSFRQEKLTLNNGSPYVKLRHAVFSEKSSPLRFRNYLTVIIGEQTSKSVSIEQSFYVSDIYATDVRPWNFWGNGRRPANQYYVREITGFGRGFGIVAGVATISGIGILGQGNAAGSKQ